MARPYIPPRARPCAHCGVSVVSNFGVFEADPYQAGALQRHFCAVVVKTPNEQDFCPKCWRLLPCQCEPTHEATHPPSPKPVAPRPPPKPAPAPVARSTLQAFER